MIELSNQLNPIEQTELEQYEQVIERGLQTFYEVGQSLMAIKEKRLYRSEFSDFETYCENRWSMTRWRARQFIAAAQTIDVLQDGTIGAALPTTERQTRPLTELETPEQQRQAWQTAVDTAPAGKVTAAHVQRVVTEFRGGSATQLKHDYDRLQSQERGSLPALFNPSDAALWDATPSVKEITSKINECRVWLATGFTVAAQLGKLSPEAKAFVARKLRELANDFSRKADELEHQND